MKLFLRTPALLLFPVLFGALLTGPAQVTTLAPGISTKAPGEIEARAEPAWLDTAIIYEIFPRSFSTEGNLNGVTAKLDDLQKLGVKVLWLMPIHPVGQVRKKGTAGSPYAVRDYYAIDPAYGTKSDLHRLIDEAHRRGMKVIIDIVANHTSFDSVLMTHPKFYKHDTHGNVLSPYDWTDVAALNYADPELRRYMTDMLLYWVKDFDLDGFRCDAAGEVPTDFWESARKELDRQHPGILLLAEASKPELLRTAFDLDYSWPLMATLNNVIEHGAPASSIKATLEQEQKLFPKHSMHMRVFDDHDEQRALARYGVPGSLAAAALIFTLDGVPMLYSGMEVSDPTESAAPALFESLKVWWQAGALRPQFPKFYSFIIPYREQHPALLRGHTIWVDNSEDAHIVTYLRRTAEEEVLVAVNLSSAPFRGTVEVSPEAWAEAQNPVFHNRQTAIPSLSLDAFEFRIFRRPLNASASAAAHARPESVSPKTISPSTAASTRTSGEPE